MDDMDLELSREPEDELTEAEYNEILGLEDMDVVEGDEDSEEIEGESWEKEEVAPDKEKRKKKKKRKDAAVQEETGNDYKDSSHPEGHISWHSAGITGENVTDAVAQPEGGVADVVVKTDGVVTDAVIRKSSGVTDSDARKDGETTTEGIKPEDIVVTQEYMKPITGEYHTSKVVITKQSKESSEEIIGGENEETHSRVPIDGREDASHFRSTPVGAEQPSTEPHAPFGIKENGDDLSQIRAEAAIEISAVDQTETEKPHTFREGIDIRPYAVNAGETVAEMSADNVRRADANYYAGQKEIRHYSAPVMEAVAIAGAAAAASAIRDDMEDCARAAIQASELIKTGKITVDDLELPRKELDEKLKSLSISAGKIQINSLDGALKKSEKALSAKERKGIVRNAGTIRDLYAVRSALVRDEKDVKHLPEGVREHIKSKAFFDLREEKTNEVLKTYCKRSKSDVLRNINPGSMKSRSIRELIKEADKKGFSSTDKAALRLLLRQKKMREARQKVTVLRSLKRYAYLATRKITEADDNVVAGVTASQRVAVAASGIYSTIKLGIKTGSFAHRTWTKYGLIGRQVGRAERYVVRKAVDGTTVVLKKTAQGIKTARDAPGKALNKTKPVMAIKRTAKEVKDTVSHTQAVKKLREAGKRARKTQQAVAAKTAKAAFVASKVKGGVRVAFMPLRLLKKAIGKIFAFFSGLCAVVAASFFGVIITYVVIVILLTGLLSIFSVEGEALMNVVLCNDESFVANTIELLDGWFSEEKEEALAIATGKPQNPNVFYGHIIDRYGAPDKDGNWSDGYKIYYRDMDGNIMENGVNNIKDVIVLAYVMMDGDFDTEPAARDALIEDLWKLLNPGVTWEETSIYTAEIGDDSYSYSCDSESDYDEMRDMRREGVRFYGSVHSYSGDGCRGDEDDRYCPGHSVDVCYGHKDIKVYITVGFMEDMFANPQYPSGESYQKYIEDFIARGGWTEDVQEWANALYAGGWSELYGRDPSGGAGFAVADTLTPEEIERLTEQYGSIDGTRSAVSTFALEMVGKIPYYWGGKPVSGDYDENHFWTEVKSDGSQYNRTKRGLDCSGFVSFVYWHVLGHPLGASSTGDFTDGRFKKISATELKPGDVGLLRTGYSNGNSVNHIGIFVGRDDAGNAIWVHCTGGNTGKTVCGEFNFSVYYSIL